MGRALVLTSGAAVINMLFLFLEAMLAARLVSTDEFGMYVLVVAAVNFVMMVVDCGSKTAITQLLARDDGPRRASLVNTTIAFRVGVIGALTLLVWSAQRLIGFFEGGLTAYLWQMPAMIFVASLDQLLFGMLQGFQAYRPLAVAQVLRSILRFGLTAILLGPLGLGVDGLLYSWTFSFGLSAVYQYAMLPVPKKLELARSPLSEVLRFGVPLQAAGMLWFIFTRIQTFILGAIAGPGAVALFAMASRIPEALQQVAESYMAVYFPRMTALLATGRSEQATRMLETSLRLVSFGAAAVALAGVLWSTEIVETIFSARYAAAAPAFAVLMTALHMVLVVNLMGYTLTSAGHPRRSLVVDLVRTGVVLGASLALVPPFAALGAACARLVSSYSGGPAAVWMLRRDGPSVPNGVWLKATAILLGCSVFGALTHDAGLPARAGVGTAFVLLSLKLGAIRLDDVRILIPRWPVRPAPAAVGDSA